MTTEENVVFIVEHTKKMGNPMWEAVSIYQEDLASILV